MIIPESEGVAGLLIGSRNVITAIFSLIIICNLSEKLYGKNYLQADLYSCILKLTDSGKFIKSDFKVIMRNQLSHSVIIIAPTICSEIYSLL